MAAPVTNTYSVDIGRSQDGGVWWKLKYNGSPALFDIGSEPYPASGDAPSYPQAVIAARDAAQIIERQRQFRELVTRVPVLVVTLEDVFRPTLTVPEMPPDPWAQPTADVPNAIPEWMSLKPGGTL